MEDALLNTSSRRRNQIYTQKTSNPFWKEEQSSEPPPERVIMSSRAYQTDED